MKAAEDKFKTIVTVDDIKLAYDRGEEVSNKWAFNMLISSDIL
jgi:hypothetical protein